MTSSKSTDAIEFDALRPRLKALLELHRVAQTEEARVALVGMFEDAFLATAWHVAHDLLENGWSGVRTRPERFQRRFPPRIDQRRLCMTSRTSVAAVAACRTVWSMFGAMPLRSGRKAAVAP